jgi:hypothetical protein
MKTYRGMDGKPQVFLNSALVGGEWSASNPGLFTPGESVPGTHLTGGPRASLNNMEK